MSKKATKKDLLKTVRSGVRLHSKPPAIEKPKSVYNRKQKHKGRFSEDSPLFVFCYCNLSFFCVVD